MPKHIYHKLFLVVTFSSSRVRPNFFGPINEIRETQFLSAQNPDMLGIIRQARSLRHGNRKSFPRMDVFMGRLRTFHCHVRPLEGNAQDRIRSPSKSIRKAVATMFCLIQFQLAAKLHHVGPDLVSTSGTQKHRLGTAPTWAQLVLQLAPSRCHQTWVENPRSE